MSRTRARSRITLNRRSLQHANQLIKRGRVVLDERDDWSEHRPTTREEDAEIAAFGFQTYGTWFLGVDLEAAEATKPRHRFLYGDFENVHRCAVLTIEARAAQFDGAVESAASALKRQLDELYLRQAG